MLPKGLATTAVHGGASRTPMIDEIIIIPPAAVEELFISTIWSRVQTSKKREI